MIRHAHICRACRLHQQLRTRLFDLQQARRGFSISSAAAQQQDGYAQHSARQRQPRWHRDGERPVDNARSGSNGGDGPPRGRYSGQMLQPEQLLDQLSTPRPQHSSRPRSTDGSQRWRRGVYDPNLPPALKQMIGDLLSRERRRDAYGLRQTVRLMQDMSREEGANQLGRLKEFRHIYTATLNDSCVRLGAASDAQNSVLPRPSELLALMPVVKITLTDIWPSTLWRVARQLVWARTQQLGEAEILHELMVLWNMAFSTRLQRQPSETTASGVEETSNSLDWSFLPPLSAYTEMLRQRAQGRMKPTESQRFHNALAMLLPETPDYELRNREKPYRREAQDAYDYDSAALVTLDALRQAGHDVQEQSWPFIGLLETIMRSVPHPDVPQALTGYVAQTRDAVLGQEYEAVLARLHLSYEPRNWSEEAKASEAATRSGSDKVSAAVTGLGPSTSGDPVKSQRQHGKMLFAYEGEGEGELTISEGQDFVVLEPDDGGGWLKVQTTEGVDTTSAEGFVPISYVSIEDLPMPAESASHTVSLPDTTADLEDGNAMKAEAPSPPSDEAVVPNDKEDAGTDRYINVRIARLSHAVRNHDMHQAEQVKQEVMNFDADPSHPPLHDKLYEHLMLALLSLRNASSAIDVWNHFIKLGRQPTSKTYTVMMRGAQHVRDVNGQEAFWHKMRNAGIQPDANAWNTRVFGMIRGATKLENGLKVLNDFGQEWIAAARAKKAAFSVRATSSRRTAKQTVPETSVAEMNAEFPGDIDGVPKPDVVSMNSAISALASKSDKYIPTVLSWGRSFGLRPDQTTYNVLLNLSMRHGNPDEAIAILQRMRDENIEPSAETWTILLNSTFEDKALDDLSHEEQQERIITLLTALESASASGVDDRGYALTIDRLLKYYGNTRAADVVLNHMYEAGVQPSPHIYTILLTHHFQQQPQPDFDAIDALLRQNQAGEGGRGAVLDGVFYDRLIEGYATHAHTIGTQQLLIYLDRMASEGRRPGWRALTLASRALADRGQWDRLLKIVDEARVWVKDEGLGDRGKEMLVGERGFGQRDFWQFVVETGLLRDEGIESPEQLMREKTGQTPLQRRIGRMVR